MEDKGGAFRGREPVEHDGQGELDLIVQSDPVGRIDSLHRTIAVGKSGPEWRLPSAVRRPDSVKAEAADDHGEPPPYVVDFVELHSGEAAERLLHDVLRLGRIAKRPRRQSEQEGAVVVPDVVEAAVCG
jgi:hypothetical protein